MGPPEGTRHEILSPLPADFPLPAWVGRHPAAHWRRSTGESWVSSVNPEDVARAPRLEWTEEQRHIVNEAISREPGFAPDENEWVTISWPPEATLWAAGNTFRTEGEFCDEHDDDYDEHCPTCRSCERPTVEVEPAVWDWDVVCTLWEGEVDDEYPVNRGSVTIMQTHLDPREVDYAEGEWA